MINNEAKLALELVQENDGCRIGYCEWIKGKSKEIYGGGCETWKLEQEEQPREVVTTVKCFSCFSVEKELAK